MVRNSLKDKGSLLKTRQLQYIENSEWRSRFFFWQHACAACANESKCRNHRRRRCLIRRKARRVNKPKSENRKPKTKNRKREPESAGCPQRKQTNKQAEAGESLPFSSVYPQWWLILDFGFGWLLTMLCCLSCGILVGCFEGCCTRGWWHASDFRWGWRGPLYRDFMGGWMFVYIYKYIYGRWESRNGSRMVQSLNRCSAERIGASTVW